MRPSPPHDAAITTLPNSCTDRSRLGATLTCPRASTPLRSDVPYPVGPGETDLPAAEEVLVEESLVQESLVEEVSITGMCGVY
jgi:mycofactocin precursor